MPEYGFSSYEHYCSTVTKKVANCSNMEVLVTRMPLSDNMPVPEGEAAIIAGDFLALNFPER